MNRNELVTQIFNKKSFLCVGLDTDLDKIPSFFKDEEDPVFEFNKHIIDATKEYAVSYKINTAFYEAQGVKGWETLEKTLKYLPSNCFSIADAKRGDIGNTAEQYAKTFFYTYPFDSVTVAPYMGSDSVKPFLQFEDKWAIILGLTSNPSSADFQMLPTEKGLLYHSVLRKAATWGHEGNTMFVIGATRKEQLKEIREMLPKHFFLVPGVGTQGGDIETVGMAAFTADAGLLVNVSRAILYAANDSHFAEAANDVAKMYHKQMNLFL